MECSSRKMTPLRKTISECLFRMGQASTDQLISLCGHVVAPEWAIRYYQKRKGKIRPTNPSEQEQVRRGIRIIVVMTVFSMCRIKGLKHPKFVKLKDENGRTIWSVKNET